MVKFGFWFKIIIILIIILLIKKYPTTTKDDMTQYNSQKQRVIT